MIHLDTHVLVWLYAEEFGRLPDPVIEIIEREALVVSPMVRLELTYLHEVERLRDPADRVLAALVPALELRESGIPMSAVVDEAAELDWTRDPFDRMIVGNAIADDGILVTADRTILANMDDARWE